MKHIEIFQDTSPDLVIGEVENSMLRTLES